MSPPPQPTRVAEAVTVSTQCRLCGYAERIPLWSFGETPLANAYLKPEDVGKPEVTAPLEVVQCTSCSLVQLRHTVSPEALFRDYLYVSSTSPRFVAHFEDYAAHLAERFRLTSTDLVVDIGSNDGILLKPLRARGIRVLGIEPSARIAAMATAEGIETLPEFFSEELAVRLRSERGPARIITANNVFAHVPDITDTVAGIRTLLTDDGAYVFEVQYLGDLLAQNLFDIVYHEHLCYYHVTPLVPFFERHGLEIFDVQRVPTHGGSIRVFVQRNSGPHRSETRVDTIVNEEREQGLHTLAPYEAFAAKIADNRRALTDLLRRLKAEGKRIVGYGAPAKATTFLSTFGIGSETLDYIVDDDKKIKQGLYMPGTHLPIVSPEYLYRPLDLSDSKGKPDYCLILAWNFAEPIMANHTRFTELGGRFIVPVPEPRIV